MVAPVLETDPFYGHKLTMDHQSHEFEDFPNEKSLCDFIEHNIDIFAKEVLGIPYLGHKREYVISEDYRVNKNRKGRVDFMFKTDDGCIFVECKRPTHSYSESVLAITQLLSYSCLADQYQRNLKRMALVTTRYNPLLKEVIKKYNLPVEVYILSKSNVMKLIIN